MDTIKVPATPGPKVRLCYLTPPADGSSGDPMVHCDRKIKHGGRHSWELEQDAAKLERADAVVDAWRAVVDHTEKMPRDREPMGQWLDERGPMLEKATMLTKLYSR